MDWYIPRRTGKNLFKELGQERGYIMVAPNGRGGDSRDVGAAGRDVLDVLATRLYPVNRSHVFLTGHSMGGIGTWTIGFIHAQRFAALAPVACSFFREGWAAFDSIPFPDAPDMPVLFSYGLKDATAAPEDTRKMAAYAKSALRKFIAEEYPGDDHFSIGVASMQRVFDFFDQQRSRALSRP